MFFYLFYDIILFTNWLKRQVHKGVDNMDRLHEIINELDEIRKTLSLDELNEFVIELDDYVSKMKFHVGQLNSAEDEELHGGWI